MKKQMVYLLATAFILGLCAPQSGEAQTRTKLAQTGFQFLSVSTDARAAAMGDAFTTVGGNSSALFHNPANMARSHSLVDMSLSRNEWIADIIYNAGSVSFRPMDGEYGTLGISVISVDYGEFQGTRVDPITDKGYIDTGVFSPTAYAIGIGYAKLLSDRFSVGGQIKYTAQSLGHSVLPVGEATAGLTEEVENQIGVLAFDLGTFYQTAIKSLAFGMTVRNFSEEIEFEKESFQLPLTFSIGVSMNVLDFFMATNKDHSFLVSIDAIHPRDYSERVNVGGEYQFKEMVALRAGYLYNYDEQDLTAGFGVQKKFGTRGFALDYAYTPFGIFDNVTRVTVRLSL